MQRSPRLQNTQDQSVVDLSLGAQVGSQGIRPAAAPLLFLTCADKALWSYTGKNRQKIPQFVLMSLLS